MIYLHGSITAGGLAISTATIPIRNMPSKVPAPHNRSDRRAQPTDIAEIEQIGVLLQLFGERRQN
jgi:hypothetical protein